MPPSRGVKHSEGIMLNILLLSVPVSFCGLFLYLYYRKDSKFCLWVSGTQFGIAVGLAADLFIN